MPYFDFKSNSVMENPRMALLAKDEEWSYDRWLRESFTVTGMNLEKQKDVTQDVEYLGKVLTELNRFKDMRYYNEYVDKVKKNYPRAELAPYPEVVKRLDELAKSLVPKATGDITANLHSFIDPNFDADTINKDKNKDKNKNN